MNVHLKVAMSLMSCDDSGGNARSPSRSAGGGWDECLRQRQADRHCGHRAAIVVRQAADDATQAGVRMVRVRHVVSGVGRVR